MLAVGVVEGAEGTGVMSGVMYLRRMGRGDGTPEHMGQGPFLSQNRGGRAGDAAQGGDRRWSCCGGNVREFLSQSSRKG